MREVANPKSDALEVAVKASQPGRFELAVDSLIQPFSPGRVSRRMRERQELGYHRAMLAYAAAQPPQFSYQRYGTAESLTSEEAQLPGFARFQMILESRDLYRNFSIIRAGVNGLARRSVATGINPVFHTSDKEWNSMTRDQWNEWSEVCEVRGLFDLQGIARQIIRSCYYDGDLGIGFDLEDPENLQSDLRLKLIESDLIAQSYRVGLNYDTYNPIGGVVLDQQTLKPIGYYVGQRGIGGLLLKSEIIPAEEMLLMFRQQRVDQVRGIPLLAPVIQTARDLDRYITATRMQANIAATYGVVVKREAAGLAAMAQSIASQNTNANGQSYRTQPLKTGLMTFLNPGESIETFKPEVPGPQFDDFARFLVRMIAVGMGTTYEYLMQDFSNMSFSASRTNLLDMTLTMAEWQRFLITKFFARIYPVWVAKRMENGFLPFNAEAYDRVSWQRPAELGVDPARDAAANVQLLTSGLDTFQNLYQEQGHEWKERLRQKADEVAFIQKLAKERGIQPELISSTLPPGIIAPVEPVNPNEKSVQKGGNIVKPQPKPLPRRS